MNVKKYDLKKVSIAFSPLWILFIFIFGLAIYGMSVGDTLMFFAFGMVAIFILIPFIIPIVNIFLLFRLEDFHKFIGILIGIKGDEHTLSLMTFIAVAYVLIGIFIVVMTILAILVIYWDRIETQLFAGLTPLVRKRETALEKPSQIRWINKSGQEKVFMANWIYLILIVVAIVVVILMWLYWFGYLDV